jgi:short-subunit dehydrogenase
MNNILITGASSGIGQALAEHYAAAGTTLILSGRDKKRLEAVGKVCKAKGSTVFTQVIDVKDQQAMEKWIHAMDDQYPVDLVIANAGIRAAQEDPDLAEIKDVFQTNVDGVLNTVHPLIIRMKQRRHGHIAVISSIASYRAFPHRGAYCASKAAVKMLCEAWRMELERFDVAVSTICPGFVKSRLTAGSKHPMPFIMGADDSAIRIAKGLAKKKAIIAYPLPVFLFVRMLQCLPVFLADFIIRMGYNRERPKG